MSLVIYASELAAVIGHNKYKPVDEALLEVLKRNKPDIYQKALMRNNIKEVDVKKVIKDLKLDAVVDKAIKSKNKGRRTPEVRKASRRETGRPGRR